MRRFCLILVSFCLFLTGAAAVRGGTYPLKAGGAIEGSPLNFNEQGVNFQASDGSIVQRQPYDNFTQDGLKQLLKDAPHDEDKAFVEARITDIAQEKVKQREITLNPVPRIERPTTNTGLFAAFGSPVCLFLMLLIYAANIYAGYEVSVYRNTPPVPVCVISAVAPVLGPIVMLSLKKAPVFADSRPVTTTTETSAIAEIAEVVSPGGGLAQDASGSVGTNVEASGAGPAQKLPEPVVFRRGEFSFNRRFFETKMPGFFRVVPSEKDKDLVLFVSCVRGDFVGRRISRIGQNDMDLEVFKDNVTANEMVPFTEIKEVQIRHKDTPWN